MNWNFDPIYGLKKKEFHFLELANDFSSFPNPYKRKKQQQQHDSWGLLEVVVQREDSLCYFTIYGVVFMVSLLFQVRFGVCPSETKRHTRNSISFFIQRLSRTPGNRISWLSRQSRISRYGRHGRIVEN